MSKRINKHVCLVLAAAIMAVILSACSNNNEQNSISEITEEFSAAEFENSTDIEVRDNIVMYYDSEETILEGKKIDAADDAEYDLSRLIPVKIYEQNKVNLYAYKYEYEVGDGFKYTDYKFLLEHDGSYQAFDYGVGGIFQYETQEFLFNRDFEHGYEYDFDNDGRWEFVEFISYIYGTGSGDTEIILFDFNENTGEYEAYRTGVDCFEDLVNECAKEFFDEYYCSYSIDGKRYMFENGVSVIITQNGNRAYYEELENVMVPDTW